MSKPKIAVIILVYNGEKDLPDCLASLKNQETDFGEVEAIFVDNASTDGSVKWLEKKKVKSIKSEKNLGFGGGNNLGLRYALKNNFDYAVLLNQDTIVDPGWLRELVKVIELNKDFACVQSRLMAYPDKEKINSLGNNLHYLGFGFCAGGYEKWRDYEKDYQETQKEIAYPAGAAMLVKTSVLKEIGLFDKDFFMYHDDLELGWRMRMAGYQIVLAPKSIVYHKYHFSKAIRKYYWMERNRFICLLTHYKWRTYFLILPALIAMEAGMFFFSLLSGWWKEKLKVYFYFLKPSAWFKIWRRRRYVQKRRKVGDKEVVKFFCSKIEFQEIMNPVLKYVANPMFAAYWWMVKKLINW